MLFFEIPEIRNLVACYAVLLGWYGEQRGEIAGVVKQLAEYVDKAIVDLSEKFRALLNPLAELLSALDRRRVGP